MFSLTDFGRMLIFFGIILILLGLIFTFSGRISHLGKLPGDFEIHKKGLNIYFPLATSLIISLLLTIILNLFFRNK
jgi:hypothetical protein